VKEELILFYLLVVFGDMGLEFPNVGIKPLDRTLLYVKGILGESKKLGFTYDSF